MSRDNWERLVAAVLRKEQLWQLCHQNSRTPSICSEASDFSVSSDLDLRSPFHDLVVPGGLLPHRQLLEDVVAHLQFLPKLVFFPNFDRAFELEDVLGASFAYIGEGTFGSVYTAEIDDGLNIAVKRLKLLSVSDQDFKQQMEIVGNINHENVFPLRAYYSNMDKKLLFYDHYPTRSMSALLHGNTGAIANRVCVDWHTRLKIAIGAAFGISHIHMQNGGKLVHGNIKASNIFLTSQLFGCVSDVGLANMIETSFMQTARCYAPEIRNTQNVTQESDVYSFGILIFELLTRKSSIQLIGGHDAVDLVKLVNSLKSKVWIDRVFDKDLLKNKSIYEQMVQMLQIGISCVAKSPEKRPKMFEVVTMMKGIISMSGIYHVSLCVKKNLVFLGNVVPQFDLQDMLRVTFNALGEGTFGISYIAELENQNTIRVKRLKEIDIKWYEFLEYMQVIGRIRHRNVSGLKAYYYWKDEKLLVYNYYNHDSVFAMLHGRRGADRIPLNWETRLKIAIGAAMGIAYIHSLDGSNLVHGNIKASNIFLNRRKYGCVSDFGLSKLVSPIRLSGMLTPEYCAPEVTKTGSVSQASDVYSFGVVLLELLSGKPSRLIANNGAVISRVNWIKFLHRADRTLEVFDEYLLRDHFKMAMVQLMEIALRCVDKSPKLRPKMAEVAKEMHEIIGVNRWKQTSS